MEPSKQTYPFSLGTGTQTVPPAFFLSQREQAKALTLLYEVSHEITSTLNREELLRLTAERVKKFVNYDVFTVMLWNDADQVLESVFSMRYEDAIPARLKMPLNHGITGTAAAEKRAI